MIKWNDSYQIITDKNYAFLEDGHHDFVDIWTVLSDNILFPFCAQISEMTTFGYWKCAHDHMYAACDEYIRSINSGAKNKKNDI